MKYCVNCIYKEEATSIYDFYQKTLTMPNMKFWGLKDFAYKNWLCSNPKHCRTDHTNNSIIRRPCEELNFYGSCINYLQSDAINIEPSTINIICEQTEFQGNEEAYITTEIIPFFIPEETETKINEETGEEEIIIIKERYDTDQVLKYKYQWYKNNRKLFKETKDKVLIDTTKDSIDTYYCKVTQILEDNGDGGKKEEITTTSSVTVYVDVPDDFVPEKPEDKPPVETKPSISISLTPSETVYDVETPLESITITAKVTKGTSEVKEVNFYVAGEIVNTITTDVVNGGTFNYTYTPENPINNNTMFKVTATDVKDATASSSQGITFIGASYYGIVNADTVTPTESEIKALNKVLKSSRKFLYQDITTDWGKVCYAYPASLGLLTNIKDNKNNFNYTDSFTYSSGKVNNIDYHIYTLTEPTAAENVELSFE